MKNAILTLSLFFTTFSWAQMGQVWPVNTRQDFDMNEDFEVTKTYEKGDVSQYFMFIDDNKFIHVTGTITSLYKITKRDESTEKSPIYTVTSEAGNEYIYIFNSDANEVHAFSKKGFAITFSCNAHHTTKVFEDISE